MGLITTLILKKKGMGWGKALREGSGGLAGRIARTVEAGSQYQKTPEYKEKLRKRLEKKRKKYQAYLERLRKKKVGGVQKRRKLTSGLTSVIPGGK